jgi:hypothetical protein
MTAHRTSQERRHPRLVEVIPAHLRLFGRWQVLPASIRNLSAGGAALLAPLPIPVHSTVEELRFALPPIRQQPGAFIAVSAVVRWAAPRAASDGAGGILHGVEFLDLEGKALTRVRNYVYYRLLESPAEAATGPAVRRRPNFDPALTHASPT